MARIRTIKPDYWKSERMAAQLPGADGREARRMFVGLWNLAEDHGVLRAAPAYIRAELYPYDEDVTAADVSRWLGMLEASGFIARFQRDGSSYAWVRGFTEHQRINRPTKPTLPEPSQQECGRSLSAHGVLTESSLSAHGGLTAGREGKGMEVEGKGNPASGDPVAAMGGLTVPAITQNALPDRRVNASDTIRDKLERVWTQKRGRAPSPNWWSDRAFRPAFEASGGDEAEILRVFAAALDRQYPELVRLSDLARHWDAYAATKGPEPQRNKNPNARATQGDRVDSTYRPPLTADGELDLMGVGS